jgi:hypothetical protein
VADQRDPLQTVVDLIADVTGAPVTLEDRDFNLVASSGHEDVIDEVRSASILRRRSTADIQGLFGAFGIARSEEPLRIPGDPATGRLSRWCIPVRWRGVTHGYVWLLDPDERVSAEVLRGLQEVVDRAAAALAVRSRAAERISWAAGELVSDDATSRRRAVEELRRQGVLAATGMIRIIALAPRSGHELGPVNGWLLPRAAFATPVGQRAAILFPASGDAEAVVLKAAQSLAAQHPAGLAAGIGGAVDPLDAHLGWRQAGAALGVALSPAPDAVPASANGVRITDWAHLGVRRLHAIADPDTLLATVSDDRIRSLLALDGDALATLACYLDNAGSAQRTTGALSIHRQTLYQRLRRIETLTGFDFTDGQQRLLAHLALTVAPDRRRHFTS